MAIFASGAGSNAQKIIDYFKGHASVKVSLVVCNKPGAGVIGIAEKEAIPVLIIEKERFLSGDGYTEELKRRSVGFIILAGFLWKIPPVLVQAYPGRILNIHPALLPKYGGKGMYGMHVHRAVIGSGDRESGITVHVVDELYDHGQALFQVSCPISAEETPESLAEKIHALEHAHYPSVIESVILKTTDLQNHR